MSESTSSKQRPRFDASDPDHAYRIAEINAAACELEASFGAEQMASWSRWLTATLAVLNSGGLLAIISEGESNRSVTAAISFLSGVALSLLSGTALQDLYNRTQFIVREQWFVFRIQAQGFDLDREKLKNLDLDLSKTRRFDIIPPALGWLSGICFLCGSGALVFSAT